MPFLFLIYSIRLDLCSFMHKFTAITPAKETSLNTFPTQRETKKRHSTFLKKKNDRTVDRWQTTS